MKESRILGELMKAIPNLHMKCSGSTRATTALTVGMKLGT